MAAYGTKFYQDYEELKRMLRESGQDYDMDLIDKAYKLADEMHGDQRRVSGVPYILHPTSVACILAELGMDSESIAAALLHDVVEDTPVTLEQIKSMFGKDIAKLINGVTKLKKLPTSSKEEQQAENVRKMFIAMADDIRVIIIKLADRLHNMRTIDCMREQKRRDIARETMELYAPIAHRLGIRPIKEEMEDLSLHYLDPIGYKEIEDKLNKLKEDRAEFLERIKITVANRVHEVMPHAKIEGRVKSINGIYRKTIMQGKSFEEIYDIFAVRVIVDTVAECYHVMGIIHDQFQPLPNRFKDYISMPKPNNYRSLHTTVVDKEAIPFEVQIRTFEMHQTAEYGIAAHWKYKLKLSKKDHFEERIAWVRRMLENQQDSEDSSALLGSIKTELAADEVFVFTPKGDLISLPAGSTTIDMAYAIHSEVGNRMIGAKVDQRIVPIDYQVKTGEIIEIITAKEGGPKRDWLNIVKTSEARSKIRSWFKRERRDENIVEGKAELMRELKKNRILVPEDELPALLKPVMQRQHCAGFDDFCAAIGYGGIQLWKCLPKIKEEYQKNVEPEKPRAMQEAQMRVEEIVPKKIRNGIIVEGLDDVLIKFAGCCNPLPGDDIVGFITRGHGLSVHKTSCSNVPKDITADDQKDRWIKVKWDTDVKDTFSATLEICAYDRTGLLADVTNQLSLMHIFITALHSKEANDKDNGLTSVYVTVSVNGKDHLRAVIQRLMKIKGIVSVDRI
ncbi:MAG: bifunctional (p)ppGpp synthetase/guanosine-3',5'-bis(diphosphate) 3'-pyrophosphohydrolase [Clostridiales bacterium]|nr:bifunctional (p)ppGpp synthetase/guanosine-3',5'-bis(diphosphate) 3'-pyrophosphohydrolase [Clostridiales bacterium]